MLEFKEITIDDKELLQSYYNSCPYESCEYSAGIKLFWNKFYPYKFAISKKKSLIIKYEESGNTVFDMPVPAEKISTEETLSSDFDEIDMYCMKHSIVPVFSDIPEDMLSIFIKRYNFIKIENFRETADYIYRVADLRDFKGRHYSGQRNHINKFKALYPEFQYRELEADESLAEFWNSYYENQSSDGSENSISLIQEKEVAMAMTSHFAELSSFVSGAIEIEGKTAAFCIGEIIGNRVIVHIEKALTEYEGIYPVMVSEFLKHIPESIEYVNREDDSSDRGLRISKLQYRPCRILKKYAVLVQSELLYVDSVPEIATERLILNEIRKADAAAYQRLCLDDERNKYWGYDYRDDLDDEYHMMCPECVTLALPDDYFFKIAQKDFEERMCLNLAIRLEDKMIGEIVFYEADCKGGIEIGCRIFEEYEGKGFGREAMLAASNWAIYSAGFRYIKARCFKENTASLKMLSSFMKRARDDDEFIYFIKNC